MSDLVDDLRGMVKKWERRRTPTYETESGEEAAFSMALRACIEDVEEVLDAHE